VQTAPGKPPLLPVQVGGRAADWTAAHRDALRHAVLSHGAVLVRGLGLRSHAEVGDVFRAFSGGRLLPERESFAPRTVHQPGVFSSTKWPANQQMCMHHEQSFASDFPGVMMFACLTAPAAGGATPVADATAVLNALPRDHGRSSARADSLRNHNDEIGSSCGGVRHADPAAVEHYCQITASS
jgi:alpha-ketoglutarate-dependent taurine dioxygenase